MIIATLMYILFIHEKETNLTYAQNRNEIIIYLKLYTF